MNEFKLLLDRLCNHNVRENGNVLLAYLWETNFYENDYEEDWQDMYKMPIMKENLKEYITEHHQVTGARDILWEKDTKEDLVLIYRKNKI